LVSDSIPEEPRQYPLVSAPSTPQRVQVKNLPVPDAGFDGEPSSALVGSELEGDEVVVLGLDENPPVMEVDDEPPAVAEVPEAVAPVEEDVAETFVDEVGLLMPWTPDW